MPSFSDISMITSFFSPRPTPEPTKQLKEMFKNAYFNPQDTAHKSLLETISTDLNAKLSELLALDTRIILGVAAGSTAFTIPLIPFSVTLAIASFGYSAYCLGKRDQLAKEYRVALSDAVACLKWTLGNVDDNNKDAVLNSSNVLALFDCLAPLMNEDQIRDAIDDKLEEYFVKQANSKAQALFDRPLNKEEKALYYGIYGYEKGGFLDVGKGLWYLACKAVNWLIQSIKSLWSKPEAQATSTSRGLPQDDEGTELNNLKSSSQATLS